MPSTFLQMIRRSEQGRLKLYLGYAPGVGKTFLMLQEAHRLKQEGIDVAVGFVESHARSETAALVQGLEVIPRRRIEYRGITLEEMDTAAVLARHPQVALVDELAHTNPPGSKNLKRFQDVEDLLAAGIHVISTMNVQHLESLYNTVEGMVSVRVAERLPDAMLKEADEIVNVDLAPADLLKRLQSGKIYPPERIALASENYFKPLNLEQLRELTLREAASQIDFKRRETPGEPARVAPDQILVCLSASGTNNAHLLRYGSRLAGRLNRRWYAVHVQTPKDDPLKIDAARQRMLSETLTLANQLGAMVFTFKGAGVVETVLRFAREYRVGHIVIGRPGPDRWWRRLLRFRNSVERLIAEGSGFRIVVLDERLPEMDSGRIAASNLAVSKPLYPAPRKDDLAKAFSLASVIVWDKPVTKHEVMADLVAAMTRRYPQENLEHALESIESREAEISTFLNEDVAVPHARLDSVRQVCVAFGLAKAGVGDAETNGPVHAIFMALYPADLSEQYLVWMSQAMQFLRNRQTQGSLRQASNSFDVLALLQQVKDDVR
ncbi:MAG TPA: PTS sugar transporter subunit IIA [bacterium]